MLSLALTYLGDSTFKLHLFLFPYLCAKDYTVEIKEEGKIVYYYEIVEGVIITFYYLLILLNRKFGLMNVYIYAAIVN